MPVNDPTPPAREEGEFGVVSINGVAHWMIGNVEYPFEQWTRLHTERFRKLGAEDDARQAAFWARQN